MKKLLFYIMITFVYVFATVTTERIDPNDKRVGSYSFTSNNYGNIQTSVLAVGVDTAVQQTWEWSAAVTYPISISSWARIDQASMNITTSTQPIESFLLQGREMSQLPSNYNSTENLMNDIGSGGTYFYNVNIPAGSFSDDLEMNLSLVEEQLVNNFLGVGLSQISADSDDETYAAFTAGKLTLEWEIRMSSSGTLPEDEHWGGTHSLAGNIIVPSGKPLTLFNGLNLSLNSYYIKSTGGIISVPDGLGSISISPTPIFAKIGSSIKGIYPSLSSALANATSGQTVHVTTSQSISSSMVVPSGVTLSLDGGTTTIGSGASLTTSDGSIIVNGATVSPDIRLRTSNGIKGLYPAVQTAINAASSGDEVKLGSGTFSENLTLVSNMDVTGINSSSTIISGDVTIYSKTNCGVNDCKVNGEINIDYGSYVYLSQVEITDEVSVHGTSVNGLHDLDAASGGWIHLHQCDTDVNRLTSTASGSYAVYANEASPYIWSG